MAPFFQSTFLKFTWKNALRGLGIVLTLAALLSTIHRSGEGCGTLIFNRYSLPYFIGLAGLALLGALSLAASFWLSDKHIKNSLGRLIMVGFGLGFGLVSIEIALRSIDPIPSIDDLLTENHETLGSMRKPNIVIESNGTFADSFSHTYHTDDLGLIIRDEDPNRPQPDAHRILMIGDSFVEGKQVSAMDNMSELLETGLSEKSGETYQITNVGVAGYNSLQYLFLYREFGEQFDPELVIVVFFVGNDFYTARAYHAGRVNLDEAGQPEAMLPKFKLNKYRVWDLRVNTYREISVRENRPAGQFKTIEILKTLFISPLCQTHDEPVRNEVTNTIQSPACANLNGELTLYCEEYEWREQSLIRNNRASIYKDTYTPADQEDIDLSLDPLAILAEEVRLDGRDFLLVIMPQKAQIPGQSGIYAINGIDTDYLDSRKPQDIILNFCEENAIICLDLLPALQSHADQVLFWQVDLHLTEAGHIITAKEILETLTSK